MENFVNKSKSELRLEEMKGEVKKLVATLDKLMREGYHKDCEQSILGELVGMKKSLDSMANLDGINERWIDNNQKRIQAFKYFDVHNLDLSVGVFDDSFLKGTLKTFGFDYSKVANGVQDVKLGVSKLDETLDRKLNKNAEPEL